MAAVLGRNFTTLGIDINMKNLLVYINPLNEFNTENSIYVKIQIDNSLQYWDTKDILLATNFPYEYHGVKATIVPESLYYKDGICINKVNTIIYLLENKILNELTWFHDTEAWQIAPLNLKLNKELGLTDYGWSSRWNGGSMFFMPSAIDMFKWLQDSIYTRHIDDERALLDLTERNYNNINSRIQRLNITYNLGKRRVDKNLVKVDKPLRVVHFHPYRENLLEKFKPLLPNNLYKQMYAENLNHG